MRTKSFLAPSLLFLLLPTGARAQAPSAPPQPQEQSAAPGGARRAGNGPRDGRGVLGRIVAIHDGSIELAKPDGTSVSVKLTGTTEFRKDRQSAKLAEFKAGDLVFIRTEESADHTLTALMVGGRSGTGPDGARGFGGFAGVGEIGKDFVVGEVKSIDAPKLTVLRTDNVMQTVELNEDTSLRKGRDSITMADIQPGDHLVARGAVQNNVFVPKSVMVLSAEQWQRMQEMGIAIGPAGSAPSGPPKSNPPQQ